MMTRTFINYSIDQLEDEYDRATAQGDKASFQKLLHELSFRKTTRARGLRLAVEQDLAESNSDAPTGATLFPPPPKRNERQRQKSNHQKPAHSQSKHKPTQEQTAAIDAFLKGGSLKINAFAGSGKTSTLEMLAHATTMRGQYIAFNRDIVRDAKEKFPRSVNCSTTHGLAFRATSSAYRDSKEKMMGKVTIAPKDLNKKVDDLIDRDQSEADIEHGQNVRDAFYLADLFVDGTRDVRAQLSRYIRLLFGDPFVTPTSDEYGMFHATAASLRSADLSRQVGAMLLSPEGSHLAAGCNEVPKSGGGHYWPDIDPESQDDRDFRYGSDKRRHRIENAFCRLKDFRRIATRYDKLARNFLASICLVAAIVWWIL